MINDRQIYECAQLLVREHGEHAPAVARMKHEARRDDGDAQGCAVWQLILAAIAAISRRAPSPDEPLH